MIPSGRLSGLIVRRYVRTVTPAFLSGDYEEWLQTKLADLLRPGDTFFDIGANGGFFSLLGAHLVGASGKVVAAEPHPETARQARAQLEVNNFTHALVVQAAVSDAVGYAEFTDGDTSVVQRLGGLPGASSVARKTIRVPTTTIDELVRTYGAPSVMKIDIEGAELLALRGASAALSEHQPKILLEIHSEELFRSIVPLLRSHGYKVYRINGETVGEEYVRFVVCIPDASEEIVMRLYAGS